MGKIASSLTAGLGPIAVRAMHGGVRPEPGEVVWRSRVMGTSKGWPELAGERASVVERFDKIVERLSALRASVRGSLLPLAIATESNPNDALMFAMGRQTSPREGVSNAIETAQGELQSLRRELGHWVETSYHPDDWEFVENKLFPFPAPFLVPATLSQEVKALEHSIGELEGRCAGIRLRLISPPNTARIRSSTGAFPSTTPAFNPMPWWKVAAFAGTGAAGYTAILLLWYDSPVVWVLSVGVLVFAVVLFFNPANWYRRMSATCLAIAGLGGVLPAINAWAISSRGLLAFAIENSTEIAIAALVCAVLFAFLDHRSRHKSR